MKLKPYKELIKMSKEKIDEALAPIRAHKAQIQAELEQAKLDEEIVTKEAKVHEMCTCKDLDFPKILTLLDEIALLERKKKQYEALIDQLFPQD